MLVQDLSPSRRLKHAPEVYDTLMSVRSLSHYTSKMGPQGHVTQEASEIFINCRCQHSYLARLAGEAGEAEHGSRYPLPCSFAQLYSSCPSDMVSHLPSARNKQELCGSWYLGPLLLFNAVALTVTYLPAPHSSKKWG